MTSLGQNDPETPSHNYPGRRPGRGRRTCAERRFFGMFECLLHSQFDLTHLRSNLSSSPVLRALNTVWCAQISTSSFLRNMFKKRKDLSSNLLRAICNLLRWLLHLSKFSITWYVLIRKIFLSLDKISEFEKFHQIPHCNKMKDV